MFKKRKTRCAITAIALFAVMMLTVVGINVLGNSYSDLSVDINNLAGSTTRYEKYYGGRYINQAGTILSKGTPLNYWLVQTGQFKDVYTTTHTSRTTGRNSSFKFIDSHQGPTKVTRTEKYESGRHRRTSFSGKISKGIVQATIDYQTGNSNTTTVSKKYTFPGDKKLHILYLTRETINREGASRRTSYSQPVTTYTVRLGVLATPKGWGSMVRHPKRDIAPHRTAATTEYLYGTRMT